MIYSLGRYIEIILHSPLDNLRQKNMLIYQLSILFRQPSIVHVINSVLSVGSRATQNKRVALEHIQ